MLKKSVGVLALACAIIGGISTASAHAGSFGTGLLRQQEQITMKEDSMKAQKMQGDTMMSSKKSVKKRLIKKQWAKEELQRKKLKLQARK